MLVCCETGNERSAALVAAYMMTMYEDADLVRTLQFIHYRRFCTNFDDDIKFLLRSYGDIVAARRMVDGGMQVLLQQQENQENQENHRSGLKLGEGTKAKRGISDSSTNDDDPLTDAPPESDMQRFSGRHLTPFVDRGGHGGDEAMELGA